ALSAGDLTKAQTLAEQIRAEAHSAHALTTGPAWWVASGIPGLGSPVETSRVIAAQADQVGQRVLPGVVQLVREVEQGRPVHGSAVDLGSVAHTFGPGHRIRLQVASSNAPRFDPNPGTGAPLHEPGPGVRAEQELHLGPTRLELPVLPAFAGATNSAALNALTRRP
ncbi:MAG: hypothetical protein J0H43_09720, partial [Actinobacteria bacterium]|nr:hypothetical protein [Actinomycetota bacterium]